MLSQLPHLPARDSFNYYRFLPGRARTTGRGARTHRLLLLLALSLLSLPASNARAAFPLSDSLGPGAAAPVNWVGTATGPASTSTPNSCREGLDCDTFVLTFDGTPADWAGRIARIRIGWQLPVTDYDLYILRELPSGQYVIAQSAKHPADSNETQEVIDFSPGFYGTGRYLVRVMYTAATFRDQYEGSASVTFEESSCRVPGVTVLSDRTGDSLDPESAHDIERVSVAEPYMIGTSKLVFTIKAAGLASLPPNTTWRVAFRTYHSSLQLHFVEMRTDSSGLVSYKYGLDTSSTLGDADEGHYNPDTGLITITVSNSKVGNPVAGQSPPHKLSQLHSQVLFNGVVLDSVPDANTGNSPATYTLVGNTTCNPGLLAFISGNDGNNEVYAMNADGSNPVNLSNNPATEYNPAWSPDGRQLAFASSRAGGNDIFVMDADGGNQVNLSNLPGSDVEPSWSPDGEKLAFSATRSTASQTGTPQIYLMNTTGTSQSRLTQDTASYHQPSWSPDGKRLAFWGGNYTLQLFIINADGTNLVRVTQDNFVNVDSAWSPDGTRIAFASTRNGNYEIYVVNTDGTNLVRLTNNTASDRYPAWSPDGLCLVFSSNRDGNYELYSMNADGSNQTRLTNSPVDEITPAWQPFTRRPAAQPLVFNRTADFDGDHKSDLSVWQPGNSYWNIINSSTGTVRSDSWGSAGDIPVPRDYDADGKTDLAVFRPQTGIWSVRLSQSGQIKTMVSLRSGDMPVPGDYDGDGKADLAQFSAMEGNWRILQSSNNLTRIVNWGNFYDRPVPGDYDGDGKTDLAVFRPKEGNWYIAYSSGTTQVVNWGLPTDRVVPADYDGDGKTDLAVFRPSDGQWYIRQSLTLTSRVQQWGLRGDALAPADYDGDGKADLAIRRPGTGEWWILQSLSGATRTQAWGQATDMALQSVGFY
ncbi:MAG TPA: FG-GAP-like repeat-containing protein [Pyrinomonadaceae bacterium]|jgi:Tol biopolymer transport system component